MTKHQNIFSVWKELDQAVFHDAKKEYFFVDSYQRIIPRNYIIAYMPIEFPKEVE